MASLPLGLYVHLPWCVRKCPYCDFNSHQVRGALPARDYLAALVQDLGHDLPLAAGRRVTSVYFGGGTPSLFNATQIGELMSAFRERLELDPDAEVTLEANPGTVERDSFRAYAQAGINRVSLGVQSFNDDCLRRLGRIHGGEEAAAAIASLRGSGIANFNIDLMYGLPGQSRAQSLADVEQAAASGATHVSHYQLTIEPNTAFAAEPPRLPGEDDCWRMQEDASSVLERHGFRQYEISAWSREGLQCAHNLNYWRYGDFIGIGAGAHGKLTDENWGIRRLARSRHPRRFMDGGRIAENRLLEEDDKVFEFFLNRLRLREPFGPEDFVSRTGLAWSGIAGTVEEAVDSGWLERVGEGFRHTPVGWRFVNDVQALFLPPENP